MTSLEQHLAEHSAIGNSSDSPITGFACICGYELGDKSGDLVGRHRAHVADAWREARVVRTVEELDALPDEASVREIGGPVGETLVKNSGRWYPPLDERPVTVVLLPALVTWTPKDGAL